MSLIDTNVQVHLPEHSICTTLEAHTLSKLLLAQVFRLPEELFPGRTFTTGATAANILGLACGREYIFQESPGDASIGELGLLEASQRTGIVGVDILCAMPHASIYKAAGVVGLGRDSVKDIGSYHDGLPWDLDMVKLEEYLSGSEGKGRRGIIVVMSWGEVNTGRFTRGIRAVREMVDKYCGPKKYRKAWIHVDGAFGLFGRLFKEDDEFEELRLIAKSVDGLECADSITADGHKMLNVVSQSQEPKSQNT